MLATLMHCRYVHLQLMIVRCLRAIKINALIMEQEIAKEVVEEKEMGNDG